MKEENINIAQQVAIQLINNSDKKYNTEIIIKTLCGFLKNNDYNLDNIFPSDIEEMHTFILLYLSKDNNNNN